MALTIYNDATYGQKLYYGSVDGTANLLWGMLIKWDGGTWENEAIRMIDLYVERGRTSLVENGGWSRYRPGRIEATFDNEDGRFDPYNSSSPLYGLIAPGKFARLFVRVGGSGGADYDIMHGQVVDIQPYKARNRRQVKITILDGLNFLDGCISTVSWANLRSVPLLMFGAASNSNTDGLVASSGWPESEWGIPAINTGPYPAGYFAINYLGDTYFFKSASLRAINELMDAIGGNFFHRADGQAWYADAEFDEVTNTEINESECLRDIVISQPWEQLVNNARVWENSKRVVGTSSETIWQNNQPIPISAGETLSFDVRFRFEQYYPVASRIVNAGGLDVNTASNGSGSNITASCSIATSGVKADGVTVTIKNGSGSNGYIIAAEITGEPLANTTPIIWEDSDETSQAAYGVRSFEVNSFWVQGPTYAKDYRDWLLAELKDPRPLITIQLQDQNILQFGKDLYIDTVNLVALTIGIDDDYRIGGIKHKWLNENGQSVLTTYHLEPKFSTLALPDQPATP